MRSTGSGFICYSTVLLYDMIDCVDALTNYIGRGEINARFDDDLNLRLIRTEHLLGESG